MKKGKHLYSTNKMNGFTIIEVLIASFILFLVISSASLIFSSTIKSKHAATESLNLHGYVPILMDHIGVQIKRETSSVSLKDRSANLFDIHYEWSAEVSSRKTVRSRETLSETGVTEALLWDVDLTISTKTKSETFEFSILSWKPL